MDQKGWKQDDIFRCMKLFPNKSEAYLVSNTAVIDHLHVLLPTYTMLYEEAASERQYEPNR